MTSTIPAVAILTLTLSATPADAADAATTAMLTDSNTASLTLIVWGNVVWGDGKVSRPPALTNPLGMGHLTLRPDALQAQTVHPVIG